MSITGDEFRKFRHECGKLIICSMIGFWHRSPHSWLCLDLALFFRRLRISHLCRSFESYSISCKDIRLNSGYYPVAVSADREKWQMKGCTSPRADARARQPDKQFATPGHVKIPCKVRAPEASSEASRSRIEFVNH